MEWVEMFFSERSVEVSNWQMSCRSAYITHFLRDFDFYGISSYTTILTLSEIHNFFMLTIFSFIVKIRVL